MRYDNGSLKQKLLLITYTVLLLVVALNISVFVRLLQVVYQSFSPILVGLVIAFLLNQPMSFFEKRLLKGMERSPRRWVRRMLRPASLLLSIVVCFTVLFLIAQVILPQVVDSGRQLLAVLAAADTTWLERDSDFLSRLDLSPALISLLEDFRSTLFDTLEKFLTTDVKQLLNDALTVTTSFVSTVVSSLVKLLVGVICAVYVLLSKEKLSRFFTRAITATLPPSVTRSILSVSSLSYTTFSDFIVGQLLESCILAALCFLGMSLFGFPYAPVISVLVGFTAIIPIIGAWIGGTLAALLIGIIDPMKALEFIVFLLVLQQLEGNLIYPRVVGKTVGIPGILVFVSVVVGSSFGGILGVLLSVPLGAVLYTLFLQFVSRRLDPPRPAEPKKKE